MVGYRWFIEAGVFGKYEPHEKTFISVPLAQYDAERSGYAPAQYGIDKVEDDAGYITVLEHVKAVRETVWEED